jgi:glycosyltransferase involved in cell wall biosynthesis
MNEKRMLILPRYTAKGPSSRVRMYQYLPYLKNAGFECDVLPFFDDEYINALFYGEPRKFSGIFYAYFQRISSALKSKRYDLVWLQYELLPWMPHWLESIFLRGKAKLMIDYDDAIFHRYDHHPSSFVRSILGKKIDRLMHSADVVIAGNDYLAAHAQQAGAKWVEIIPSVVDAKRYLSKVRGESKNKVIRVGWVGSPTTIKYLLPIENVIKTISDDKSKFIIIGADLPTAFEGYPVESWKWSLETEMDLIQKLDIGIMPLVDTPFERGKCGYKLIQYMACGLPVVASPVGINQKIVRHGENGFLTGNEHEWIEAITLLKENPILRREMGLKGREMIEDTYALQVTAPKIINIINQIGN